MREKCYVKHLLIDNSNYVVSIEICFRYCSVEALGTTLQNVDSNESRSQNNPFHGGVVKKPFAMCAASLNSYIMFRVNSVLPTIQTKKGLENNAIAIDE